jgi:hypothetical protein
MYEVKTAGNTNAWDLQYWNEKLTAPSQPYYLNYRYGTCPNCGYCPNCGRGMRPYWQNPIWS